MYIEKKAIILQRTLYFIFVLIGVFTLTKVYIDEMWFLFTFIGIVAALAVLSFVLYKKDKKGEVVNITQKELDINKYVLYAYMFVYLLHIITNNIDFWTMTIKAWIFGPILIIIGLIGVVIQQLTLNKNK